MKKLALLLIASFCILEISAAAAQAGEVAQCGVPEEAHVTVDPGFVYCNIYDRRFAYKENAKKLRADILARQQNFRAPRQQAADEYKVKEAAMHAATKSN